MNESDLRNIPEINRLSRYFASPSTPEVILCPCFGSMAASHQAHIVEIYRIAAEKTQEQLRPRRRSIPAFSRN